MTPGQHALAEAARLEAARVYGRVQVEHRQPAGLLAAVAEAELRAALARRTAVTEHAATGQDITDLIVGGYTTTQIIERLCVSYSDVRAARKRLMAKGAA